MHEFDELLHLAERLLAPNGCPWDREQTLFTLQTYLLEETHELIEAIDLLDGAKIAEELGDLLYALIFVAKLGEAQNLFQLSQAIRCIRDKLIRRHPHIFGDVKADTPDEVLRNWEEIKKKEFQERKSALDGIPPTLPILARSQKMIRKIRRAHKKEGPSKNHLTSEEDLGRKLWEILEMAEDKDLSAEDALRRFSLKKETDFRAEEKTPEMDS